MTTTRRALAAALILGLAASGALFAQEQGRILLTVQDQNNAPLPDVKVTITSPDFKFKQEKKTDKKGQVSILLLDATRQYVMTLEKEGFLPLEQPIKPQIGETMRPVLQLLPQTKPAEGEQGPAKLTGESQAILVYNEGVTALQGGDQATALAKFQQAAELDPKQSAAFGAQAEVLLAQGKNQEAAAAADKLLELQPGDKRGLRVRYDALHALGEKEKERAAAALEELIKADPSHDTAVRVFNEGAERTRSGKMDEAITYLNRAIEIDPKLEAAYSALGNHYLTRKKYKEAVEVSDKHLAVNPASLEAMTVRYEAYKGMGDKAKAKEAFDAMQAATSGGGTPDEMFKQGVALFNANNFEQAKATFEKVLQADPKHAKTHYMMGLVYANAGDVAKAKQYLTEFLQIAPNDPDAATAKEMIESLN
jgi:tetratricopeptide (TPR) repeat protein